MDYKVNIMFKRVGNDKINIMRLFTVLDILKFIWKDLKVLKNINSHMAQ